MYLDYYIQVHGTNVVYKNLVLYHVHWDGFIYGEGLHLIYKEAHL
jgi:hypothetical protein